MNRLKLAIFLCRLADLLIPKPAAPAPTTNPEPISSPLVVEAKSYYISYSFTHAWPHMNSPRQMHFGSCTFDLRCDLDSGEKVEGVRQGVISHLQAKGFQAPYVNIVGFQKLGTKMVRVES